jgi:DtxR family Mn-dependent transcriptional regulator
MSDRVERKILALLEDHRESPYGSPIPGLAELGDDAVSEDFRTGLVELSRIAGVEPRTALIRRIGEPVQVDAEALGLLSAAGLRPGEEITVRRDGGRVVAALTGRDEAAGVSLPDEIAAHVFVTAGA